MAERAAEKFDDGKLPVMQAEKSSKVIETMKSELPKSVQDKINDAMVPVGIRDSEKAGAVMRVRNGSFNPKALDAELELEKRFGKDSGLDTAQKRLDAAFVLNAEQKLVEQAYDVQMKMKADGRKPEEIKATLDQMLDTKKGDATREFNIMKIENKVRDTIAAGNISQENAEMAISVTQKIINAKVKAGADRDIAEMDAMLTEKLVLENKKSPNDADKKRIGELDKTMKDNIEKSPKLKQESERRKDPKKVSLDIPQDTAMTNNTDLNMARAGMEFASNLPSMGDQKGSNGNGLNAVAANQSQSRSGGRA